MLRIGFNGKSVAETTDADKNPNGEDVNKGWHQIVKEWKDGQQIITDAVVLDGDGKGDYVSLDAMASDLINAKIPAQYRNDPRLVVWSALTLWRRSHSACTRKQISRPRKSPRSCCLTVSPAVQLTSRRLCRVNV